MNKRKQIPNRGENIGALLRRYLGQRTVLGVAIPVLAGHLEAAQKKRAFTGLTESQIATGFRELTSQFISSDYHSTYIDRRLGSRGFLDLSAGRYKIRAPLLNDIALDQLEKLHDDLVRSLRTAYEERQAVIRKLKDT